MWKQLTSTSHDKLMRKQLTKTSRDKIDVETIDQKHQFLIYNRI
jgi:hypothetical protein